MTDHSPQPDDTQPRLTLAAQQAEHAEPPLPPEESDVGVGLPIAIGLVVVSLLAISLGVSAWLMKNRGAIVNAPPSPLAFLDNPTPAPHLEYDPPVDLARLRADERALLDTYGWVDRDKKIVRIPIERAMKLLIERGLPTAVPASPAPATESQSEPAPTEAPAPETTEPAATAPAIAEPAGGTP